MPYSKGGIENGTFSKISVTNDTFCIDMAELLNSKLNLSSLSIENKMFVQLIILYHICSLIKRSINFFVLCCYFTNEMAVYYFFMDAVLI